MSLYVLNNPLLADKDCVLPGGITVHFDKNGDSEPVEKDVHDECLTVGGFSSSGEATFPGETRRESEEDLSDDNDDAKEPTPPPTVFTPPPGPVQNPPQVTPPDTAIKTEPSVVTPGGMLAGVLDELKAGTPSPAAPVPTHPLADATAEAKKAEDAEKAKKAAEKATAEAKKAADKIAAEAKKAAEKAAAEAKTPPESTDKNNNAGNQ